MTKEQKEFGSARASAIAYQTQMMRLGEVLSSFEKRHEGFGDDEGFIKAIRFVPASPVRAENLLVITAFWDGADVVAFQRGFSLAECLQGFINRLGNGSIKWKEDEYAEKHSKGK